MKKERARTETKETQLRTFYSAQDWSWNQEKRSSSKETLLARMLNIHSTNDTQKTKTKAFAPQSYQGLSTHWQALHEPAVQKIGVVYIGKANKTPVFFHRPDLCDCSKAVLSHTAVDIRLPTPQGVVNWKTGHICLAMFGRQPKNTKMRKAADTISKTNSSRPKLKRKGSSPFTTNS